MRTLRYLLLVAVVCSSLLLTSGGVPPAQGRSDSLPFTKLDPLLKELETAFATRREGRGESRFPRGVYHMTRGDSVGRSPTAPVGRSPTAPVGRSLIAARSRVLSIDSTPAGPWANVLIHTTGTPSALADLGVQTMAQIGDVVTARVPLNRLDEVAAHKNVVYVQAARRLRVHNDVSVPETGAHRARVDFGATGRGVLIGYVDTGIDFTHGDFRNPDGSTRIKYLLDLSDPGDTDGDGELDGPPENYGGTLYTEAQINAALSGTGAVNQRDIVGHGTHGAGSAAGNGLATDKDVVPGTYAGVAPEANLIVVKAARDNTNPGVIDSIDVVNALSFVDQKAQELRRPYVVNLSFGGHLGAHDGSSEEERAIDQLVGAGARGKAVVISAGNERGQDIHAGGWVPKDGAQEVSLWVPSGSSYVLIDIWYSGQDIFHIGFRDPDGQGKDPTSVLPGQWKCLTSSQNEVCITSEFNNPNNGDKEILLEILPAQEFGTIEPGEWHFILHGALVWMGRFDAWAVTDAWFTSDLEPAGWRVAMPGTARNAITVGAYVSRNTWVDVQGQEQRAFATIGEIAYFSSDGPTRDRRLKPEITVPGQEIGSSYSADARVGSPYSMFPSDWWVLKGGLHAIGRGTSFSAPHVTGAVALLFERDPTLDAIQAREILTSTARADVFTGLVPNQTWGFGKLDAYAALQSMGAVPSAFKVYQPLVVVDR